MADIAKALRLGVEDVLLKPVKDLNRLREMVFACLIPACLIRALRKRKGFSRLGCNG